MSDDPVPLTAPMEHLRLPDTPRIGCEVRFRPYGKPLDHASYYRWEFTDGRSVVTAWDASPHETALYRKGK